MEKFKTYRVLAEGANYVVVSRTEQEAIETVKTYILQENSELEESEENWSVKEDSSDISIVYDEYDEEGKRIIISSIELLKSSVKPEILGCSEWYQTLEQGGQSKNYPL